MSLNYYQNTFKNFNSDFFCLIPSKYVTFGLPPLNKMPSQISENSSSKDNNIIFQQFPSIQAEKFKFDFDKSSSKEKSITSYSKSNTSNKFYENNNTPKLPNIYYESFKKRSFSILNMVNSCLLDLFINTKNNKKDNNNINDENNSDIEIPVYSNRNYVLKALNEDCVLLNNNNNKNNGKNNSDFFLQKINVSPIKNINSNENIQQQGINKINEKEKMIETNIINEVNNNNIKSKNKFCIKSAFNIINNNYENPAKILPQFNQPPDIYKFSNMIPNAIHNITNITNVTNNYFFQCDHGSNYFMLQNSKIEKDKNQNNIIINKNNNLILQNSTFKISKSEEKNPESKLQNKHTIINSNDSYGLYQLNQISVNGVSISKFPVVSMNEDDLEVQLLSKMLTETDYFSIVDKYYINIPVLDEEKYNKPLYDKIFKKEKEKISDLYIIEKNLNENNPVNLIRNFYAQIKSKILQIQTNYLSNNKQQISLNEKLCKELEKLITSCNAITNTVTDYKKSGLKRKVFQNEENEENKNIENINCIDKDNNDIDNPEDEIDDNNNFLNKKRKQKKKHFKTYLCEFCNKAYSNGQGLGGHMSRIHPNQSYKYKDKIRIRREREEKREILLNIKRDLFKKYGFDYDKLSIEKNKIFIQKFLTEHNEEYKNERKNRPKNEKNKENISNDNEEIINKESISMLITPIHPKLIKISPNKLNTINDSRKILSKEKTCDKTTTKNEENKANEQKGEIDFETKIKINFGENKC